MDHDQPAVDRTWERLLVDPSPLETQYLDYSQQVVEWQAEKFNHDLVDLDDLTAARATIVELEVWLARALALLTNHPLPEVRVTWYPRRVPCWGHNDTWSNEFTAHPSHGQELTPEQWALYTRWSDTSVYGTVVHLDDHEMTVDIRLDHPAVCGSRFVRYPYDTASEDPISLAADEFHRAVTLGGCYDYEHGCRCPSCLEFQATEA